ncbi:hypothetical protein [Phascolarctobacterium faecium]|uniref:hypothetical protein n=1 Tax=Phascolarctobacterium faecium TaxID=33025 RepID=UPI003AB605E7
MKDTIKEYLAGQYDAYVKDLETLTNIDSGNGDLQGTELLISLSRKKCRSSELLLNSVIMTGRAI